MRRIRKKFKKEREAWSSTKIKEREKIIKDYGLRRKEEILKTEEMLRNFRSRAREAIATKNEETSKALLDKLIKLGLLKPKQSLDDVLTLTINYILDRRLETLVWKKGLANSPKQARQLIVHGHIAVNGKRATFPSSLVPLKEEAGISFYSTSKLKGGK